MNVYIVYPGHSSSTIDVATGWEGGLRAAGCKVRGFDYHNVLTFYREAFTKWKESNPDFAYDDGDLLYMASRSAVADVVEHPPDAILAITGMAVHLVFYNCIKRLGLPLAVLLTECPYTDEVQLRMCEAARPDAVFVNDKASLTKFAAFNAVYLPHSYDPERHYPRMVGKEYQSDVCFIGTMYPEREELLGAVDWAGINTKFVGPGLEPEGGEVRQGQDGRIDNEETAKYYCGAKIVLNLNRTVRGAYEDKLDHISEGEAWSLGPRAYEIAACGSFQLAQSGRGELKEVYRDSVPEFKSARELGALVRYYLQNEGPRQGLARLQRKLARGCSFEERAKQIVMPALEGIWQQRYMARTA